MIHTVVAQLEKTGQVTRGYIGVEAQQVSDTMAKACIWTRQSGALIAGVQQRCAGVAGGSGAGRRDHRGERPDGEEPARPRGGCRRGASRATRRSCTCCTMATARRCRVKVGQMPNEQTASNETAASSRTSGSAWRWHRCRRTCATSSTCRTARTARWCATCEPGSPAEQAGLQAGDVIVGVGDKQVTSPSEAASAIRGAEQGSRGRAAHHPQRRAGVRRCEPGSEL